MSRRSQLVLLREGDGLMKREYLIAGGVAFELARPNMKRCATCGKEYERTEKHFRKRLNARGENKGWHADCHTCYGNNWQDIVRARG